MRLGYRFADRTLLLQALTHRSYANEQRAPTASNETLALLGDAVLALLVIEGLWTTGEAWSVGTLTERRAAAVADAALARWAAAVAVGAALRLGHGERSSGGAARESVLATALEAVIGAVFLDGGLDAARCVVAARGV